MGLLALLEDAQRDRVGCYKYEPVASAPANELAKPVAEDDKGERLHRFMEWQRRISEARMAAKIGRTIEVIIDETDAEGAIGRPHWDAPVIDGRVFLNGDSELQPVDLVKAQVEHAGDYVPWAMRGHDISSLGTTRLNGA